LNPPVGIDGSLATSRVTFFDLLGIIRSFASVMPHTQNYRQARQPPRPDRVHPSFGSISRRDRGAGCCHDNGANAVTAKVIGQRSAVQAEDAPAIAIDQTKPLNAPTRIGIPTRTILGFSQQYSGRQHVMDHDRQSSHRADKRRT
jgi:hypothetical protein